MLGLFVVVLNRLRWLEEMINTRLVVSRWSRTLSASRTRSATMRTLPKAGRKSSSPLQFLSSPSAGWSAASAAASSPTGSAGSATSINPLFFSFPPPSPSGRYRQGDGGGGVAPTLRITDAPYYRSEWATTSTIPSSGQDVATVLLTSFPHGVGDDDDDDDDDDDGCVIITIPGISSKKKKMVVLRPPGRLY